jgi:protein-tyrosine phosphatase
VPLADDDQDPLLPYLDECCDFLADRLSQTNVPPLLTQVLVHCIAGVSRAPAVAIAFLMRERRLSLEDAFSEVKSRRKIVAVW